MPAAETTAVFLIPTAIAAPRLCEGRKSESGMPNPADWSRKSKLVPMPSRFRLVRTLSSSQRRKAPIATRKAACAASRAAVRSACALGRSRRLPQRAGQRVSPPVDAVRYRYGGG
jgi:hypothetical protein